MQIFKCECSNETEQQAAAFTDILAKYVDEALKVTTNSEVNLPNRPRLSNLYAHISTDYIENDCDIGECETDPDYVRASIESIIYLIQTLEVISAELGSDFTSDIEAVDKVNYLVEQLHNGLESLLEQLPTDKLNIDMSLNSIQISAVLAGETEEKVFPFIEPYDSENDEKVDPTYQFHVKKDVSEKPTIHHDPEIQKPNQAHKPRDNIVKFEPLFHVLTSVNRFAEKFNNVLSDLIAENQDYELTQSDQLIIEAINIVDQQDLIVEQQDFVDRKEYTVQEKSLVQGQLQQVISALDSLVRKYMGEYQNNPASKTNELVSHLTQGKIDQQTVETQANAPNFNHEAGNLKSMDKTVYNRILTDSNTSETRSSVDLAVATPQVEALDNGNSSHFHDHNSKENLSDNYRDIAVNQAFLSEQTVGTETEIFDLQPHNIDRNIIEQIIKQIELVTDEHRQEINIQLKPDYLGSVSIKLAFERGLLNAQFTAENQAVRDLIATSLPQLRINMQALGLSLGEVSVQLENQGSFDQSTQQQQSRFMQKQISRRSEETGSTAKNYLDDGLSTINLRV